MHGQTGAFGWGTLQYEQLQVLMSTVSLKMSARLYRRDLFFLAYTYILLSPLVREIKFRFACPPLPNTHSLNQFI